MHPVNDVSVPSLYHTLPKYDQSSGQDLIRFIERFIKITSSSHLGNIGDPVVLQDWQKEFIWALNEQRDDGMFRYKKALLLISKKNGKSFLLSALVVANLFMRESNSTIAVIASTREQAGIIFKESVRMIKANPTLREKIHFRENVKELVNTLNGSMVKVYASDVDGLDGILR